GAVEQVRAWRNQQPDRILHRVHMVNQAMLLNEVEHLQVVIQRCPRSERNPRRTEGDSRCMDDLQGFLDVRPRVMLLQDVEYSVAERLDGGDHEQAARSAQLGEQSAAFQDVLDLRGEVEGERRKLRVQGTDDLQ